jgi:hypothetical protein
MLCVHFLCEYRDGYTAGQPCSFFDVSAHGGGTGSAGPRFRSDRGVKYINIYAGGPGMVPSETLENDGLDQLANDFNSSDQSSL